MKKLSLKLNSGKKRWACMPGKGPDRRFSAYRWLAFCGEDIEEERDKADRKFRKMAVTVLAAALFLIILGYVFSGSGPNPAELLIRDSYGEEERVIVIDASASYGGERLEKQLELTVKPMALTREDAEQLFDACEEYLDSEVIVSDEVSGDLTLPERSPDGLVEISWHSSDPSRIAENGDVNLLEIPRLCVVRLTAALMAEGYERELSYVLTVKDGNATVSMERSLDLLGEELSSADSGSRMELPDERDGMQLRWNFPEREAPWELVPFGAFILLALYFGRYDAGEKHMKKLAADFEYEIPSMTLQLILLLNAGLVVSSAFDELIDKNKDGGDPLYTALAAVREKAEGENLPFVSELYVFANTTGCRDFIRLASLILDHSSRGSELADKLEKERAQLWSSRLSLARSRTKEAETKLCLPLMLLLIVLVVIAAAPALMTM